MYTLLSGLSGPVTNYREKYVICSTYFSYVSLVLKPPKFLSLLTQPVIIKQYSQEKELGITSPNWMCTSPSDQTGGI